jgi:hypothetical protein
MSDLKYHTVPNVFRCEQQQHRSLTYSPYKKVPQGLVTLAELRSRRRQILNSRLIGGRVQG